MIIDFHNLNGGGGGGTAEYATSAGTSNKSKLLLSESSFPQSANTGDVVAIGETQPSRGTKGGTKAPVPSIETGVYQYDGSDWNKIGENSGSVSAYIIELSTNNPEDFTETDIANLNAFFAAVMTDPSIMYTAYINVEGNIYHISWASYDESVGEGEFNFVISYPNWIENLVIGYEMEEFSYAETRKWEGNTLIPTLEFPADPIEGQIANYDDGEGNIGLYRFDGEDWQPYGGGDSGEAVYKIATTEDAVSGEVGTTFVDRIPVEKEETFEGGEDDRGHNLSLKRVMNVDYGEVGTGEGGFSFSYYILPEIEGYFTVDDSINCELSIDNNGNGYDLVVTLIKIVGEEEVESDELVRETFDFDSFEYSDDILLPSWCLNFGEGYPQMSDIYLHVFVSSSSDFGEYEVSLVYIPDGDFNFDNDLKRFSFSSGDTTTGIMADLEPYKAYIDYKAPAEWNRKLQIVSNEDSEVVNFNLKPNEHVHYRILDSKDLWGYPDADPYASEDYDEPQVGDMCFDRSDGCLYVWCNADWQEIYNSGGIM